MRDADYVFYELTRSICPECRRVIDAHILIRDNKVFMRKRCPDHGQFEALVYSDAALYLKVTRLHEPRGALFGEGHVVFTEPYGWFEGANLLRSKLPPAIQQVVRDLRRELLKAKKK